MKKYTEMRFYTLNFGFWKKAEQLRERLINQNECFLEYGDWFQEEALEVED